MDMRLPTSGYRGKMIEICTYVEQLLTRVGLPPLAMPGRLLLPFHHGNQVIRRAGALDLYDANNDRTVGPRVETILINPSTCWYYLDFVIIIGVF